MLLLVNRSPVYFLGVALACSLIGSSLAGPFYECRPGSEQRYQVNLCVDRCPEVGSARGCSGNRTCCLVGCARICFHDRRTTPSPEPVEPLVLTTTQQSTSLATSLMLQHGIAQQFVQVDGEAGEGISGSGANSAENSNATAESLAALEQQATTLATLIIGSENSEFLSPSSASASASAEASSSKQVSSNEVKEITPSAAEITGSGSAPIGSHSSETMTQASIVTGSTPVDRVLGKLRFSSAPQERTSELEQQSAAVAVQNVKSITQWNGVSDNFANSLDDAQNAAGKGDNSLIWQIFEFLRIIQTKIDLINTNSQTQASKWASMVSGGAGGAEGGAVIAPIRSKPALSPNDPNILVRKALSDFSKTLGKIQTEVTTLSNGQQQIVRLLERVFVNQLRLATGAAAVAAANPSSQITRRQQRWQQQSDQRSQAQQMQSAALNQLAPLAEALLLDNASLLTGTEMDASNCYRLNGCSFDICRLTKCSKHPDATCRINSCRNCAAEFFIGSSRVTCD